MLGFAPLAGAPLGASGVAPQPSGTYVLTAAPGAFVLTGIAATFKQPPTYVLSLDPGAFHLVGDGNAIEFPQYLLHADTGVFTLTGQAQTYGRPVTGMAAEPGSFNFAVLGAAGRGAQTLIVDTGTLHLSGSAVSYLKGFSMPAGVGAFHLGGTAALNANRGLAAAGATYSLKGSSKLTMRRNLRLALEAGALHLAGGDVTWSKGYGFYLEPGAFRLTRAPATVAAQRRILAEGRDLALHAADAGLLASHFLPARSGTFDLLGDGTMARGRVLPAAQRDLHLRGSDAALGGVRRLVLAAGAFTLARGDAGMVVSRALQLGTGTFTLRGGPSTGQQPRTILGEPAVFTLGRGGALLKRTAGIALEAGVMSLRGGAGDTDYSGNYNGLGTGPRWAIVTTIEAADRASPVAMTTYDTPVVTAPPAGKPVAVVGAGGTITAYPIVDQQVVTIEHGLDYIPRVTLTNVNGEEFDASVAHGPGYITVDLGVPTDGTITIGS
jgi:hypothetical protein